MSRADRIVERQIDEGDVSISMGGSDKGWWMRSRDGEIDELVTDDELLTIVDELVARKPL